MPVLPGDSVLVQYRGTCFGQRIICDLTYRCSVGNVGLATAAVLDELLFFISTNVANGSQIQYLACLPPQYSLNELRAQVIKPTRSAFRTLTTVAVVGTNVLPATVACDSAAIRRATALAGRDQISVLKVGPAPDGASAAGLLTPAYVALLAAFASRTLFNLVLPVSTCQFIPTILTKTGIASQRDLINFTIGTSSRVMSRRVVGRGE